MSKKSIKLKNDTLWSKIIKLKAGGVCEVCNSPLNLNSHHVVGRIIYNLRWSLQNGCCLCAKCHFAAHNNPVQFLEWFKQARPDDYEFIKDPKWQKTRPWSELDFQLIYQNLKEVINGE